VTSGNRELLPSISATLAELKLDEVDSAASQLLRRYAQQLDDSIWAERAADKVLKRIEVGGLKDASGHVLPDDDFTEWTDDERASLREEVGALRAKLAARTAVADLGPKLLTVLEAIGATPMARAKIAKMVPPSAAAGTPEWLADMQSRRRGA
jgi:hypothetical protein